MNPGSLGRGTAPPPVEFNTPMGPYSNRYLPMGQAWATRLGPVYIRLGERNLAV